MLIVLSTMIIIVIYVEFVIVFLSSASIVPKIVIMRNVLKVVGSGLYCFFSVSLSFSPFLTQTFSLFSFFFDHERGDHCYECGEFVRDKMEECVTCGVTFCPNHGDICDECSEWRCDECTEVGRCAGCECEDRPSVKPLAPLSNPHRPSVKVARPPTIISTLVKAVSGDRQDNIIDPYFCEITQTRYDNPRECRSDYTSGGFYWKGCCAYRVKFPIHHKKIKIRDSRPLFPPSRSGNPSSSGSGNPSSSGSGNPSSSGSGNPSSSGSGNPSSSGSGNPSSSGSGNLPTTIVSTSAGLLLRKSFLFKRLPKEINEVLSGKMYPASLIRYCVSRQDLEELEELKKIFGPSHFSSLINSPSEYDGDTAFHRGTTERIIKFLLACGGDPWAKNIKGRLPLASASNRETLCMVLGSMLKTNVHPCRTDEEILSFFEKKNWEVLFILLKQSDFDMGLGEIMKCFEANQFTFPPDFSICLSYFDSVPNTFLPFFSEYKAAPSVSCAFAFFLDKLDDPITFPLRHESDSGGAEDNGAEDDGDGIVQFFPLDTNRDEFEKELEDYLRLFAPHIEPPADYIPTPIPNLPANVMRYQPTDLVFCENGGIGIGAFADVVKAMLKTREGDKIVAVKKITIREGHSSAQREEIVNSFFREVLALYSLTCPYVTSLHGVVYNEQENIQWVIMSLLSDQNLGDAMKEMGKGEGEQRTKDDLFWRWSLPTLGRSLLHSLPRICTS